MNNENHDHTYTDFFSNKDYLYLLHTWYAEFNTIKSSIPSDIRYDSLTGILFLINKLISFLEKNSYSIPNYYIITIENKIEEIKKLIEEKKYDEINPLLYFTLEQLLSLNNFIHLDSIELDNNSVSKKIEIANENLKSSNNILELSNLKGLSGEFELQYNQYNSERKFWGVLIIIILIALMGRTIGITINPIDPFVLIFYIVGFLLLFLWISPNFFQNIINLFLRNKSFLNTNSIQKRITLIQITLILTLIEFTIFVLYTLKTKTLSGEAIKLFNVSIYTPQYHSLQDFLPSLSLYIPLIWALWFSVKQYHYTIKLMNAYRFKMALSLAYNGYKKECDELGNTDHKEHLMHEVLTVVADDPTKRDFKDTHMPWAEIKEIFNIASKNK